MTFGYAESTTLHTTYETAGNVLFLQGQLLTEEGTVVYCQPFHARDEIHIVTFEGVSGVNLENLVIEGENSFRLTPTKEPSAT